MKKYLTTLSSLIFIIATISSCSKTEDKIVPTETVPVEIETVNLNYSAVSSNLTNPIAIFPITKGQSASITWNNATLKISNLIFTGKRNSILEEYKVPSADFTISPSSINLASTLPKIGVYMEATLKMEFKTSFTGPPITISGVYVDQAGDDWPVSFVLNENLSLNVSIGDVALQKSKIYYGLISFFWSGLTNAIITDDFPIGSKGGVKEPIIISSTSNVALYQKFKANLANIVKLSIN